MKLSSRKGYAVLEGLRMKSMAKMRTIKLALLVFGMSVCAAAQNNSQSQPATTPVPAFGQNAQVLNPENPPVSGLDEPGLNLHTATRSFISPALQVSESADTNGENRLGDTNLQSTTRVLGALDLQQFWSKSDLFLEYLGGGAFYNNPFYVRQLQAAGLEAVTRWRTGQMTVRDAFSYLPDGSFSIGAFGALPGLGLATGGMGNGMAGGVLPGSQAFGNGPFGAIGDIPRLANTAILDAVQAINPKSAITVVGAFSNAHFFHTRDLLTNSDGATVEGGDTPLLSRHDQVGAVYAFQLFQFPQDTGGQIYNHIVNLRWSHTISGRMSLIAGAGNEAHPSADGMAPAQIDDVVINLAAGILRKLKQLKSVDGADLIVAGKQVAVPALNSDLVAVDQKFRVVEEMSVAECTHHGNRGLRIDGLNRIENRRVREPGNVSNSTALPAAEGLAAGPE